MPFLNVHPLLDEGGRVCLLGETAGEGRQPFLARLFDAPVQRDSQATGKGETQNTRVSIVTHGHLSPSSVGRGRKVGW